jgi:xanthine dehydrogenase accessory factor
MESLFETLAQAEQSGQPVALATITETRGSTPRAAGAKMVVRPDGSTVGTVGGGELEARVIQAALGALEAGEPRLLHYNMVDVDAGDPGICGGQATVCVDIVGLLPTLLVAGAGHMGRALARLGKPLGFRVVVADDRAEYANAESIPEADQFLVGELSKTLTAFPPTQATAIVIVTRAHHRDQEALEAVLDRGAGYIGMIGSRRKIKVVFDNLRAAGYDDALLSGVRAPIGLDIGAESPEEIALAILAEIIMLRRGGTGNPLKASGNQA